MATAKKKTKKAPKTMTATPEVEALEAAKPQATEAIDRKILSLVSLNKWFGLVYVVQAVSLLFFSATKLFPIQAHYVTNDAFASADANHGVVATAVRNLFDINLAYVVVLFLLIFAAAHGCVAYVATKQYAAGIRRGRNRFRWVLLATSGSLVLLAVALLAGVYSLATLILIVCILAIASILGGMAEAYGRQDAKLSLLLGKLMGIGAVVPLLVIGFALFATSAFGDVSVAAWTYVAFVLFVLYVMGMGCLLHLQHQGKGRWADAVSVERLYLIGTLGLNTALAWAIFASALHS